MEKQTKNSTVLFLWKTAGQNSSFIVFCWGMLGLSSAPKTKRSFFCISHGLNALLCHPSPKKTRAPFSLPAARTQWSLLMQLLLPVSVPTAEDDGHAKPTQRQNSLHNISRENTVHAGRERKLNQHHTGGCVLSQLIFSLRGLGGTMVVKCRRPAFIQGGCVGL